MHLRLATSDGKHVSFGQKTTHPADTDRTTQQSEQAGLAAEYDEKSGLVFVTAQGATKDPATSEKIRLLTRLTRLLRASEIPYEFFDQLFPDADNRPSMLALVYFEMSAYIARYKHLRDLIIR